VAPHSAKIVAFVETFGEIGIVKSSADSGEK
jgi:hypothetical protein